MGKIKLVMFDLEGTLIKHTTRQVALIKEGINSEGVEVSFDIEANYSIRSEKKYHLAQDFFRKVLELNNTPQSEEKIKKMVSKYKELRRDVTYLANLQYLFEGTKEILSKLKEKGIKLAILTNANPAQNNFLLEKFDIKKYFDLIIDDSCNLPEKPSPTRVNHILDQLSIKPQNSILVDDSIAGLFAGKNAKTLTCGVLSGNSTKEMFKDNKIDYILESVKDLEEII